MSDCTFTPSICKKPNRSVVRSSHKRQGKDDVLNVNREGNVTISAVEEGKLSPVSTDADNDKKINLSQSSHPIPALKNSMLLFTKRAEPSVLEDTTLQWGPIHLQQEQYVDDSLFE